LPLPKAKSNKISSGGGSKESGEKRPASPVGIHIPSQSGVLGEAVKKQRPAERNRSFHPRSFNIIAKKKSKGGKNLLSRRGRVRGAGVLVSREGQNGPAL